MKKYVYLSVISLFIVTLFYSCSNSEIANNCNKDTTVEVISYAETGTLGNLFPLSVDNALSQRIISLIHEGLVTIDPLTLSIKPGIAETWRIDQTEKEYRFYLNTNVYFNKDECFKDGTRKLTADDVIYSLTKLCTKSEDNKFAEAFVEQIEGAKEYYEGKSNKITGIVKENDSTILIKLTKPNPMFLQFLASPAAVVYPKEAYEKYGKSLTVGVGPFYIKQFPENNKPMILCKNNLYFKKDIKGTCLPYLDTIKIYFQKSVREQLELIKDGKLDIVINVNEEVLSDFLEKNIKLFEGEKATLKLLPANTFTSVKLQHILKSNIENFFLNDFNHFDLRELKIKKSK